MSYENSWVTDYWVTRYVHPQSGLCTLCGNTGQVDTRGRAISAAGIDAGVVTFCICPNGQVLRAHSNTGSDPV